jgi:hypothetical protein
MLFRVTKAREIGHYKNALGFIRQRFPQGIATDAESRLAHLWQLINPTSKPMFFSVFIPKTCAADCVGLKRSMNQSMLHRNLPHPAH